MLTIDDVNITGKRVLIREDLNVPYLDGKIINDARIMAALPTLKQILAAKAKVMVVSHLGRPKPGVAAAEFSLRKVADRLAELLPYPVKFVVDWINGVEINSGELVVAENVRFLSGETENDLGLAKQMAQLCDVFVMDAFGSAHRAHASTTGITEFVPVAVAGPLLVKELQALDQVVKHPQHPVLAIIGGAKVSSKLPILQQLIAKVDCMILGGGIANTFLAAQGYAIGASLYEQDMLAIASELLQAAKQKNCTIMLPQDAVVANEISAAAKTKIKPLTIMTNDANSELPMSIVNQEILPEEKILDIGPKTIACYKIALEKVKTILWNGPVGVFEYVPFAAGTNALALAIAQSQAFSVAGGGETLAAIEQLDIQDKLSFVSTGGGAFLEYIEGKVLPAVAALSIL